MSVPRARRNPFNPFRIDTVNIDQVNREFDLVKSAFGNVETEISNLSNSVDIVNNIINGGSTPVTSLRSPIFSVPFIYNSDLGPDGGWPFLGEVVYLGTATRDRRPIGDDSFINSWPLPSSPDGSYGISFLSLDVSIKGISFSATDPTGLLFEVVTNGGASVVASGFLSNASVGTFHVWAGPPSAPLVNGNTLGLRLTSSTGGGTGIFMQLEAYLAAYI